MKKLLFSIIAISSINAAFAQGLDRSIKPKAGPVPKVNIAEPKFFTLDNGLRVYVVENHKQPLVSYSIQFDLELPNDNEKAGLKSLFSEMMSTGTKKRSKDQFLDDKDAIGATIVVGPSSAFAASMSKQQDKLLELFSDVLLNPNFSNEELIKLKKQSVSGLRSSENNPTAMMSNVSDVVLYGKNHPFTEIITEQTLKNINLSDFSKYYRTYIRPNVAYMAIVGDITVEEAKKLVTKYFSNWQKAEVPKTSYPAVPQTKGTQVHFVNRNGAVQSNISITNTIDLKLGHEDISKASIMNYILGGGSSSNLFLNLREDKAWTYGAYSSISPSKVIGNVNLNANCRNEVTDSAVAEMLKEMQLMKTKNVDPKVLQGAKNYINGVFALGLRSPETIASYAISIDKNNLPKDYYKNYMQRISNVSVEDIKSVANKYLTPEATNIIVVGNRTEVEKLKRFDSDGSISFYNAYGESAAEIKEQVIDGNRTNDVINKYITAIGGEATIQKLTSIDATGSSEMYGNKALFEEKIVSPGKYYMGVSLKEGTSPIYSVVLYENKGFMEQQGSKNNLPGPYVAVYKLKSNLQALIQPDSFGVSYELVEKSTVDGQQTYLVNKYSDNGKTLTKQYYAINSGLLIKEEEIVKVDNKESIKVRMFKDYREVKGLAGYKMPFLIEEDADGKKSNYKYESIKANVKIPNVYFK